MTSATDPGRSTARVALLACALLAAAPRAATPAAPRPPRPAGGPVLASSAGLRDILEKAGKRIDKAGKALEGRDPGRVSLILRGADEQLDRFEKRSGLEALVELLGTVRAAAGRGDAAAAGEALGRVRDFLPTLADYTLTRTVEVTLRAAGAAAAAGDGEGLGRGLAGLEGSILAPVLLARVQEARQAIARARAAMVRRDMETGRAEAAAARRALEGLRYAGALSRACFALRISSELLRDGASIAARDQARRGVRDLRTAVEFAPEPQQAGLVRARTEAVGLWRRMIRPEPGDAEKMEAISGALETVRGQQT